MDKRLAITMLDFIEKMSVENLALRTILETIYRDQNAEHMDVVISSLLKNALNAPAVRDVSRAQWLPLRRKIESGSNPEDALTQFARIVPPTRNVN